MNYTFKLSRRLAVARVLSVCAVAFTVACDVDPLGSGAEAGAGELALSPARATAEPHQQIKLAFRDQLDGGVTPSFDVEWTVVGGGGTIAPDGSFTATEPGVYTIIGDKGKGNGNGNNGQGKGNGGPNNQTDTSVVVVVPPPPTLTAIEVTPGSASLQISEHLQFDAVGRDESGATVAIGVEWSATGGTIDAGGHFIAGTDAGAFVVVASHEGSGYADTANIEVVAATVEPAPAPAPAPAPPSAPAPTEGLIVDEDFSSYGTIEELRATTKTGRWRTNGYNPDRMSLDPNAGFDDSPHALKYTFPNRSADGDPCSNYSIGRTMYLPSPEQEIWVEAYVKFSVNFTTRVPVEFGCTNNPDLKLIFGMIDTENGRFQVKVGKFGHSWAAGYPGDQDNTLDVKSAPYYDDQWHRLRMYWKAGGDGAARVWLDDQLVYEAVGVDVPGSTIYGVMLGANMNQGPVESMSYWWGSVRVWDSPQAW